MSLYVAPKTWLASDWVTANDISGTGGTEVLSDIMIVPLPTVSIVDLALEVEFSHEMTSGLGNAVNRVKIIRSHLFGKIFTTGSSAEDFLSVPQYCSSTKKKRNLLFKHLQVANASTTSANSDAHIRVQIAGECSGAGSWATTGIRARVLYLPL